MAAGEKLSTWWPSSRFKRAQEVVDEKRNVLASPSVSGGTWITKLDNRR